MRIPRPLWLPLLLAATVAGAPLPARAAWETGCLANLESDLKRQDLAAAVGLRYYSVRPEGISRRVVERKVAKSVTGKKGVTTEKIVSEYDVTYFDPKGKPITDAETIAAIDELGIPKAYTDVWISADPKSHVLAIGLDAKKRPQYAYHPLWDEATAVTKFIRMGKFGNQIADVRRAMLADLRSSGLNKRKLLAAAATILETGNIRVGSAKYVAENGTYGLTTLLHEHVRVEGSVITFDFVGKEHVAHRFSIDSPEVAPVFAELLRGPGPSLFQYADASGAMRAISAADVADYLREVSGGHDFTAKDFRTWQGTTAAARKLLELGPPIDAKDAEAKIKLAVEYASSVLRNTPAIARERYIHGLVLESYAAGERFQVIAKRVAANPDPNGLSDGERVVLELIRRKIQ